MPISQLTAIALYAHCSTQAALVRKVLDHATKEGTLDATYNAILTWGEVLTFLVSQVEAEQRNALRTLCQDPDYNVLADTPLFDPPASS